MFLTKLKYNLVFKLTKLYYIIYYISLGPFLKANLNEPFFINERKTPEKIELYGIEYAEASRELQARPWPTLSCERSTCILQWPILLTSPQSKRRAYTPPSAHVWLLAVTYLKIKKPAVCTITILNETDSRDTAAIFSSRKCAASLRQSLRIF